MNQVSELLKSLVPQKGRSNAEVGRMLGVSGQLLGQYMAGKKRPKPPFYLKWKEVFGEDLLNYAASKVSRETNETFSSKPFRIPSQENWDDLVEELKENNAFLREMLRDKMNSLARGQLYIEAHLKAGLHLGAEILSTGSPNKKKAVLQQINTDVADQFQALQQKDIAANR